jgi:plastocyanin
MSDFLYKSRMLGLVAICLLLVLPAGVSAITVSGSKYMGSIAPGGTDIHTMTVGVGSGEDPTDILVGLYGFGQSPDQSYTTINPANDTGPYSARSFITLDNSSLHLEPGVPQTINAKISVPANTGPGGRYALILIHALPSKGQTFTTAVLVPVLITISGTTPTETGSITGLSVGEVTQGQPITVTTTFTNTGNYHYYGTVNTITISDATGNPVGNFSTQPSAYAIIPGNTVQFIATPNLQNIPVGTYTVDSKVLLNDGTVLDEKNTTFSIKTNYIPPVTESNITLTPASAATLTSPDGRYSVTFPQGSVLAAAVVTMKPYPMDQLSTAPSGAKLGATSFAITGLTGLLSKAATVKVTYSADDLAAAGGDASQLKLAYFDTSQGAWVILPTQVNSQDTTLTTTANQMGIWAVMVSSSTSPGSATTKTSLPAVISVVAIAATAIVVGGTARKRK